MLAATARIPRPPDNLGLAIATSAAALIAGAMAGLQPALAAGVVALLAVTALTILMPVAQLLLLIAVTAMVPPEIQNQLGVLGGTNAPGLLASDLLLAAGLARAITTIVNRPLERRELVTGGLALALMLITTLQAVHGVVVGTGPSDVAAELRVITSLGACVLIAMPLLAQEGSRRRLLSGLIVLGLAIGTWGILQWVLGLRFTGAEEALAGSSSRFLTAGRTVGQYAFGVATVMALAAWTSGAMRPRVGRWALLAVVLLNIVAVLFTFERTFWAVTALGVAFVTIGSRGVQRIRLVVLTPAVLVTVFLVMLTVAPAELEGARTRLSSVGKYQSDDSAGYRIEESRRVLREIRRRPLQGSGLGASIVIGRPGTTVTPKPRRYAENGYLWVAWKLGVPGMIVLLTLLGLAIVRRGHPDEPDHLVAAARRGAQAGLLTLAAAAVTFPSFNALGITPAMGVLLALCAMPRLERGPSDQPTALLE